MANKSLKKSTSKKNLFYKALGNGIMGLPGSYLLNILIVIPLVIYFSDQSWFILAALIAIPFFTLSVIRMYIIDYYWFKHKVNVDPKYIMMILCNKVKVSIHLLKRLYDRLL